MKVKKELVQGLLLYLQAILASAVVYADITVKNKNGSELLTMDSMEADFGPSIADSGITGYVVNVDPPNACKPVKLPPDSNITSVWIALIMRANCTFAEKVRNVQVGYAAAIVYNYQDDNSLLPMRGDSAGVDIPSVFVGWSDGQMLSVGYCYDCPPRDNMDMEKGFYTVTIEKDFSYNPYLLWPFAVVVGTCFVIMLIFLVVKWCRDLRRKRKSRLSTKHLKKIPTKKFKKGDEYDVCAICLDDYEEGDKLRLLPCSHVYHTKCIDPWLTKNKRSCPICKRRIIPGADPDDSDSDSSDGSSETSNERTPLLGNSSGSSITNRRSTFDNSGLPEAARPPPQVRQVNETQVSSDSDSDDSDSEAGAVGGVPPVRLSKENLLLSFKRTEIEFPQASSSQQETVVVETNEGKENHGYVVEGEDLESDDSDSEQEFNFPTEDVVFSEAGKKEEKKTNGII